jgi:hypothetical protein
MKKVMLGLVMVVMLMSMVGCGNNSTNGTSMKNDEDGFTPNQVTELPSNTEESEVKEEVEEEDLTQYYDVEQFVGTPRKTRVFVTDKDNGYKLSIYEAVDSRHCVASVFIDKVIELEHNSFYKVIVCDNNTPDDYSDDVVVYIFTE